MTVEKLIKELTKIPNQQLPVFFKSGKGLLIVEGAAVPIEKVRKESVITMEGQHQTIMLMQK